MIRDQKLLVCITQQKTCERLIRRAEEIKEDNDTDLLVLHVAKNGWNILDNPKEGEALEYLFSVSKAVGANLYVLRSDDVINTIAEFASDNGVTDIILGSSPEVEEENKFFRNLRKHLKNVSIHVIPSGK